MGNHVNLISVSDGSAMDQKLLPDSIRENEHKKLKVNLSVPQLAYLLKMLNEVKPNVFDVKSKTELFDSFSQNYLTKGTKEGISSKSISNRYNDPDKKTVDFWIDILKKMLESSRKIFT